MSYAILLPLSLTCCLLSAANPCVDVSGTPGERRDRAAYLAAPGSAPSGDPVQQPGVDEGKGFFDENCGMCHSSDGQWAIEKRPRRDADAFYEMLGRLPEINETMPPFPGNDSQRRAVASHLAKLTAGNPPPKDQK